MIQPLEPDDPRTIGTYRLLRRLGVGGMGRVYLARSPSGRTVAVKVIHPHHATDEQFRARFRREVAYAQRVNPTGNALRTGDGKTSAGRTDGGAEWTAPVLDADPDANLPWVATGYVAGPSLEQAVAEHGPLPETGARVLGAGLAEALLHVHGLGLVHRDVKPSNVLLTLDGPRLIDFGIARATDGGASLTSSGVSIGSPGYMSPEQVLGKGVGAASDVFSLGAVLAYAATGTAPFPGDSAATLLYRVVHEAPELDGLSGELRELAAACLDKEPERRPKPAHVAERLAGAHGGAGALVQPGWLPAPIVEQVSRRAVELLELEPDEPPAPFSAPPFGPADGIGSGPVPFTSPAVGPDVGPEGGSATGRGAAAPDTSHPAAGSASPNAGPDGGNAGEGLLAAADTRTAGAASPHPPTTGAGSVAASLGAGPRGRRLSCTLVLSVACVLAVALLAGAFFSGLLPFHTPGSDEPPAATPGGKGQDKGKGGHKGGEEGGKAPEGSVSRKFVGSWKGAETYTDSGAPAGEFHITIKRGKKGARIGYGGTTLAGLECKGSYYLASASPKKLVAHSRNDNDSPFCTSSDHDEFTLGDDGALHHVSADSSGKNGVKGTLRKAR